MRFKLLLMKDRCSKFACFSIRCMPQMAVNAIKYFEGVYAGIREDKWRIEVSVVLSILIQWQALREANSSLYITTFGVFLLYLLYKENSDFGIETGENLMGPICHISVSVLKLSDLTELYLILHPQKTCLQALKLYKCKCKWCLQTYIINEGNLKIKMRPLTFMCTSRTNCN